MGNSCRWGGLVRALRFGSADAGRPDSVLPAPRDARSWRYVLLFALMILPFFEPRVLSVFVSESFTALFRWLRVVSAFGAIALYVRFADKRLYDLVGISVPLLILLSTFLNAGIGSATDYKLWVDDWLPFLTAVLLVGFARSGRIVDLVRGLLLVTALLSVANFIFVLLCPAGLAVGGLMDSVYLLGHKNVAIYAIVPSVGASLILDAWEGKRCSARSAALYAIGFAQCLIAYSATSVVALVVLLVFFVICLSASVRGKVTMLYGLIAYGVISVAILVFRLQTIAAPIIEGVLHKSLTFTLRTDVWDGVMSLMAQKPLLGYGLSLRGHLEFNGFVYAHPHNELLSVLLAGGFVCLILYILFLVVSSVALYRRRGSSAATALTCAVFAFLAVGLMEPLYTIAWPMLVALCYSVGRGEMHVDCEMRYPRSRKSHTTRN